MNAVAAIASPEIGILALMGSSQATAPSSTASDAAIFLDLFHLLLPAGAPTSTNDAEVPATADTSATATAATASLGQIAGAPIRSTPGTKQEGRSQKTGARMPASEQPGSCAGSAGVSDPSVSVPGPMAVPFLPAPQPGDALTNVPTNAAVAAEPAATALPGLDRTGLESPLAFGVRLVEAGSNQDATLEPAPAATAAPPVGASQPVMLAKYEPSKRDPQEMPAPAPASAESPASQAIPAVMLATASDHAAPSAARLTDAAPQPVAEALRASEPAQPAATPGAAPAQEIVLRVARPESSPVDVQVTQRSGEVYVAVRTGDPALQASLRQELPSLVNSLERAGYHAETFTPQETSVQAAAASFGSSFGKQQQNAQPDSSDRNSPDASGGRQQEQRQRDQRQQNWLDEMEK